MRKVRTTIFGLLLTVAMLGAGAVAASGEHPGKHPGPGPGNSFGCAGPDKPASCPGG